MLAYPVAVRPACCAAAWTAAALQPAQGAPSGRACRQTGCALARTVAAGKQALASHRTLAMLLLTASCSVSNKDSCTTSASHTGP